jgi:threonine dehydratase
MTGRDVVDAHRRIAPRIRRTPCIRSRALSEATGADVWLKLETRQLSGSFKLRGVMNTLLSLSGERRGRPLVTASTGNHGAAFAHAVGELGLDGRLFLPTTVTAVKLAAIEAAGLPFELVGDDCVDTERHAREWADSNDAIWVSPYNESRIVAGQGPVAVELIDQLENFDSVLVPVGGGGLAAGMAVFLDSVAPAIDIVGCQPETSAVMAESVATGRIVELPNLPTLSDATAGGIEAGAMTFELCRDHVDTWRRVSEDEIADAIRFLHAEGLDVEGGAALPVGVLLRRPEELEAKTVVAVITGSRIDPRLLEQVLAGS